MIAVKLEGRLGNQLFQYAFIYSVAKTLKTSFYIDKSVNDFILPEYFNLKKDHAFLPDKYIFNIKGYKNIFSFYFKNAFYDFLKKMYGLKEVVFYNEIEPLAQFKTIKKKTLYTGFFQSEEYFAAHMIDIQDLFTIKPIYKQHFENILEQLPLSKKYVTIHVRRGDYINLNYALDAEYYHRTIDSIHTDNNCYIFISDDPEFIKQEFKYLDKKYISENTEIIDFQFLTHADICILSNSSFSWWGAYLNIKQAQIIAPKYWLGKMQELPVNVLPAAWQKTEH